MMLCVVLKFSVCLSVSAVFACLGFLSPANRGSLMTCVLVLYVCLGTPAGYVSARVYKSEFTVTMMIVVIMMMMMMMVVLLLLLLLCKWKYLKDNYDETL